MKTEDTKTGAGETAAQIKYILTDTFNGRVISRHNSLGAAVAAKRKHGNRVEKANGKGSYVTYRITTSDESEIDPNDIIRAEHDLANK